MYLVFSIDHFNLLPDPLLLHIFNKIGHVKALGRCCVVFCSFRSLVPQVENVVVYVDCVISDDDSSSSSDKSRADGPFSNLFRLLFGGIIKSIQASGQFLSPKAPFSTKPPISSSLSVGSGDDREMDQSGVTHHSPTQILRNFDEICFLRIELPNGELGIDDGLLLKWIVDFGSILDICIIIGAASVTNNTQLQQLSGYDNNGSIPESFYTNGGLMINRAYLRKIHFLLG